MATAKRLYLFGGAYDDLGDVLEDLKHLQELHKQKHIGRYDALAISKDADGQVKVVDVDASVRGSGAKKGALAGGALMVLFPPSILVGAAAGAAAGAVANNLNKRIGRDDAEALGALLEPREVGVLVAAEDVEEAYSSAILRKPKRQKAVVTDVDANVVAEALEAGDGE